MLFATTPLRRALLGFAAVLPLSALALGPAAAQDAAPKPAKPAAADPARPAASKPAATKPAAPAKPTLQEKTKVPPPGPAELPLFGERAFQDKRSGMSFTTPAGWMVIEVPELQEGEVTKLFLEGPGSPPGSCGIIVQGVKHPNMTQAQLNKLLHDERNAANIRKNLAQGGRTVASTRKLTQSGVAGMQGVIVMNGNTQAPSVATVLTFFEAINRRYTFNCNILTGDMDTQKADIDALIKTVKFSD